MHLLSVDHFQASQLEWGTYNTLQHVIDAWKWSTDKRCICNEGTYLKIHTLVHIYFLGMVKPTEKKRKKKELEFNF